MNTKTIKLCEWNMCWQQWTSRHIGLLKQTRTYTRLVTDIVAGIVCWSRPTGTSAPVIVVVYTFCFASAEVKCNSRSNTPLPISKHKHVKWHWNNDGGRWWHCCYSDGGRWNCCNNDRLPTRGHLCTPRQPRGSACSAADARITTI